MKKRLDQLLVYGEAIEISVFIRDNLHAFIAPNEYEMKSQIMRSLVSIPSNISEGVWSGSDKNFARYLKIAIGSSAELYTQIELCKRFGWADEDLSARVQKRLESLTAQLLSLKNKLERF
jgi:four helix bundle protein